MIVLAGDIGGTKTRLQLTDFSNGKKIIGREKYFNAEHKSLVAIIQAFLQKHKTKVDQIDSTCIAVAGPIVDGTVEFTNLPWFIEIDVLKRELGMDRIQLINDFEAIGYGVETLGEADYHILQQGVPHPNAPKALIGAGTGLGVGLMFHNGTDYSVIPTEGGHTDFAPTNDDQMALLKYLRKKWHRVSAERVVAGQGLVNIYQFVRDNPIYNEKENQDLRRELHRSSKPAAVISSYATEKGDPMALRAVDIFIRAYGGKSGDLALTTLCFGGLYLVGGIAPKLLRELSDGRFTEALCDKGRMSTLISDIPVYLVMDTHIGLQGAANYAHKMSLKSANSLPA